METELGPKLKKVLDDFDSADLLRSKNRAGPVFSSKETDTMFILSAHLKGYRRENIKVEIIENWTIISISGAYPIEENLMVGMKVILKETKMRRFRKGFRIPVGVGVILNKINARFNKHESLLTISMPKLLREFSGVTIEEVNLDKFVRRQSDQILQIGDDEVSDRKITLRNVGNDQLLAGKATREANQLLVKEETRTEQGRGIVRESGELLVGEETRTKLEGECSKVERRGIVEESGELLEEKATREADELPAVGEETRTKLEGEYSKVEDRDIVEESGELLGKEGTREADRLLVGEETQRKLREEEMQCEEVDEVKGDDLKGCEKPCSRKFCACCKVAGSALLVSLVLIVFHFVRAKNQPKKKKNKS